MVGAVLVGVEVGLADKDADADFLCAVDGVLGELGSCLTKAETSGPRGTCSLCSMCGLTREFPNSSRNILRLFFWLSSMLGGYSSTTQMQTHQGCCKTQPFTSDIVTLQSSGHIKDHTFPLVFLRDATCSFACVNL